MTTISFKVTDEEAREIHRKAKQLHLTVSEFLRRRACGDLDAPAPVRFAACEFTGATIFAERPDLVPLTVESVREMLSDFP